MIESIKILPNSLRVRFKNKYEENYPNIWLRDHTKDERNWDRRSHQRKTFTASLDLNIQIKEAKVRDDGNCIDILWADMENSVQYSYEYLFKKDMAHLQSLFSGFAYADSYAHIFIDSVRLRRSLRG